MDGLSLAPFALGIECHLWFVGDPGAPGHEVRDGIHLHRWCQWISEHLAGGVYDGERQILADFSRSWPPFLLEEPLEPHLIGGGYALVLAEEWHTAHSVC